MGEKKVLRGLIIVIVVFVLQAYAAIRLASPTEQSDVIRAISIATPVIALWAAFVTIYLVGVKNFFRGSVFLITVFFLAAYIAFRLGFLTEQVDVVRTTSLVALSIVFVAMCMEGERYLKFLTIFGSIYLIAFYIFESFEPSYVDSVDPIADLLLTGIFVSLLHSTWIILSRFKFIRKKTSEMDKAKKA